MEGRLSGSSDQLMHSKMEGIWLLDSYFPPKKGFCTTLVYRENCPPSNSPQNNTLIIRKHQHQDETKMKSEIDGCPKKLDLTHMIALKFSSQFLGPLHISHGGFFPLYHGHILHKFQKSIKLLGLWSITCIQYFWFTLMGFSPPRL